MTLLLESCQDFVDHCIDRETNRRRESAEHLTSRLKLGQDTWNSILSEKNGDQEEEEKESLMEKTAEKDQDGTMKWSSTCEIYNVNNE